MIQNLLATLRVELRGVVTTLICAAVAASAALVGVLFIAVAIFIWASENYGRLTAATSVRARTAVVLGAGAATTALLAVLPGPIVLADSIPKKLFSSSHPWLLHFIMPNCLSNSSLKLEKRKRRLPSKAPFHPKASSFRRPSSPEWNHR